MPPPGSRDPPVLLVFIRGRWQRVPPEGRFAVARRGKLEELRSGAVHGALRRFLMGLPSKARLGARLSFKKIPPLDREDSENEVSVHVQPRKRTRDSTSSEKPVQRVTTVATIHAEKRRRTELSSESKSSENEEEILIKSPKKLSETSRTDLINQKSKKNMKSPAKSPVSPKISLSLRRKHVEQTNSSKQSSPILKSKDLSENQITRYLQPKSGKQKQNPKKGETVSDSDFETDQNEIIKSKLKQDQSPKKVETVLSDSDFETDQSEIIKSKTKQNHSPKKIKGISNSELATKSGKSSNKQNKFHKIGPKRQKLNQDTSESESPKKAENIFKRANGTPIIGTTKVLDIDEQDIELIRKFLQKHYTDSELLKFDEDDEYKRMIFYRINPLVNIELCPIIDRMLRASQDSQITVTDFALYLGLRSVTEAASFKNQRYKIRKRTVRSYVDGDSDSSSEDSDEMPGRIEEAKILKEREHNVRESNTRDNIAKESKNEVSNKRVLTRKRAQSESEESNAKENDNRAEKAKERAKPGNRNTVESDSEASNTKENNTKANNTKKQTKKEVHNKVDTDSEASNTIKHNKKDNITKKQAADRNPSKNESRERKAKRVHRIEIDNTVELSSESEKEEPVKAVKKTTKTKPVISTKRKGGNLEYSTLEDHAIVAWVSTGSRASRVNGNVLWRQLQDQYMQITGIRRTWHSLRNRYLRYILPKLGDLALPLSQQTRLRAAAATGELKAHKARSPRRNSIFKLPPRGAASRRPVATNDNTHTENKEVPANRPRSYSSLTRQFTRRHQTRPSSELSDNSLRSNKLEVADRKEPEAKENVLKKPNKAKISPPQQINGRATGDDHNDSDRQSESPRRDIDSSDSSSESGDESTNTNEPRITRRSLRTDTTQNTKESKPKTRQSNILNESDESKSHKSRGETDKHKSQQQRQTNKSPSLQVNRQKSQSELNSRDSSESMSESRRKSPENNRRRSGRHTKNINESDNESDKSKIRNSSKMSISRSPTRKLNRNNSPSKQSSKGSNTSMSQVRRKSKSPIKHKKTSDDSSSSESDSSNESVSQSRRKSNRINSSQDRSTRLKTNRLISPRKPNGHLSSDPPRRKSNRLTPNESSNKRRHSSESKRKSKLPKRDSLDQIVVSDSSESFETKNPKKDLKKKVDSPKKKVEKQKMRRLFNPKTVL